MDEGRLGNVRRREDTHRKYMCVINDVNKSRWELLDGYIKRDEHDTMFRLAKSVTSVRKSLVKQRVLQQCMKMRRDRLDYSEKILGRYGGKPAEAFSRDVENVIDYMHPKRRRMRKLQSLKVQCIRDGAILLPTEVESKINEYFTRAWRSANRRDSSKDDNGLKFIKGLDFFQGNILPPIPTLKKGFHKIPLDSNPDKNSSGPNETRNDVNKLDLIKKQAEVKRSDKQSQKHKQTSDNDKTNNTGQNKLIDKPDINVLPPLEDKRP